MTEKDSETRGLLEELKSFDFVQFTVPDIHGVPKGRLVPREQLAKACRDGVGVHAVIPFCGFNSEMPYQLDFFKRGFNAPLRPVPGTARPMAWVSGVGRQVGQVMCHLEHGYSTTLPLCPRAVAQRQLDRLQQAGFRIMSAFECEMALLETNSLKPVGGKSLASFDLLNRHLDLFTNILNTLRDSGVHVEYLSTETEMSQYEMSMEPQWGMVSADEAFTLRSATRAVCRGQGMTATFMPVPLPLYNASTFHLNHSLWAQEEERNVLHDPQDPLKLSPTARHWLAGLLHHAPALTALTCPTVNCYRRLQYEGFAPATIFWDVDSRLSAVRVKTANSNVCLENRIPSSACNPYLVLAATIAAGLDGVQRQLPCPPPGELTPDQDSRFLPSTLSQALDALDNDHVIKEALDPTTVDCFIAVKRDFEVSRFQRVIAKEMGTAEQVKEERDYYIPYL